MDFDVGTAKDNSAFCKITGRYDRNDLAKAFTTCQQQMTDLKNSHLILHCKEVTSVFGSDFIASETERIIIANNVISAFREVEGIKIAVVANLTEVNGFGQFLIKMKGIPLEFFDSLEEALKWISNPGSHN
ncbi:MAG: hypothetical protein ABIJ86_14300 [Spirochaetota bacterium]